MSDFDFMGETKLMGYGESDSSGAWIKLQVLPDDLETFRGLKGEVFETALRNVDRGPIKPAKPEKGPHGQHAKDLILSGFLNSAKVREFFGGDEAYQAWVRTMPSAISGTFEDHTPGGDGVSVYAHVRRSGESGTAYKPKYSGIPLTYQEHAAQHQYGETACLDQYNVDTHGKTPAEWFEAQANNHLKTWLVEQIKGEFNTDSLTKVEPVEFYRWADFKHLDDQIPNKLINKYSKEYHA